MESEKVKEIKKKLQQINERELSSLGMILQFEIDVNDILTLINELESENDTLHTNLCEWRKENQQIKYRIAELEEYIKGNEADARAFVNGWHKDLETELTRFAERLKEKRVDYYTKGIIDETLKEFVG